MVLGDHIKIYVLQYRRLKWDVNLEMYYHSAMHHIYLRADGWEKKCFSQSLHCSFRGSSISNRAPIMTSSQPSTFAVCMNSVSQHITRDLCSQQQNHRSLPQQCQRPRETGIAHYIQPRSRIPETHHDVPSLRPTGVKPTALWQSYVPWLYH
jgi:hypothetical protein